MFDTICAISTALGVGAISIVRVSGPKALNIANKIFSKDLKNYQSHTIIHGFVLDGKKKIDEVLVSIMKAPKTYTGEDVIEINCHGGISSTNKVLELLLQNGCRLAEPGEFTKRAFLNGKIDLLKAEAVGDIINAQTDNARNMAMNQVDGKLSLLVDDIREEIIKLLSNIEVNIDYPEYDDIEVVTKEEALPKLNDFLNKLHIILNSFNSGKLIRDGINVSIIGKPNVGKSSLLNCLLEEEKAIVTDIAGTTRDMIEGRIILNGFVLNLIDTAGIRKTNDVVENIGVNRSIKSLDNADLIILVLNSNEKLTSDDKELLSKVKDKKHIIFVNKSDLPTEIDLTEYKDLNIINGNTLSKAGVKDLLDEINRMFNLNQFSSKDLTYISNVRQYDLIKKAVVSIESCVKQIKDNMSVDIIAYDLKNSFDYLGQVVGKNYDEELLDEMFKRFCLGK